GFKDGTVGISRLTGIPVLGVGLAADRFRALGTWDRMILPGPFSRVVVAAERLEGVPPDLSREEMERHRARYERGLMELTREAERAIGMKDPLSWDADSGGRAADGGDRTVGPRGPSVEE
ncbi:MAG: hypothetical protein R3234_12490, partial [Thermoanaerobaculia bacterium]|nr:hypothetical protein [Thermoanaerobaculia bacterium]